MDLPGPDRKIVAHAVLVSGTAVDDPRLAQSAVETARWFHKYLRFGVALMVFVTCIFVFDAIVLHIEPAWILAGLLAFFSAMALIPLRRYKRAIRLNSALIA